VLTKGLKAELESSCPSGAVKEELSGGVKELTPYVP